MALSVGEFSSEWTESNFCLGTAPWIRSACLSRWAAREARVF